MLKYKNVKYTADKGCHSHTQIKVVGFLFGFFRFCFVLLAFDLTPGDTGGIKFPFW